MKKIALILIAFVIIASCKRVEIKNNEDDSTDNKERKISLVDSLSKVEITESIMTPELLWKFGRVFDAQLSPNEKTIVYNIQRYNSSTNKGYIDIFSVNIDGGEPTQLTNFVGPELNQRWNKDGSKIYFLSSESESMQIWNMNADGSEKKQISFVDGDINSFELSPKNNYIYYAQDTKVDKTANEIHSDLPMADVKIIDDLMYRHWNNWTDENYSHIFLSKLEDDKINNGKDIMQGERWDAPLSAYFDNAEITWSPDEKYIAYTCKKLTGKEYAISTNSDIYLYDIETEETKNITKGMMGYDKYPRFSPNSKKIAWQSMETPGYESDKDRLFVMDLSTSKKEYITENFDQNASSLVWNDDNETIHFISGINATYQIYKVNTSSKTFVQVTKGYHNYNSLQKVGKTIIGTKMSMKMATEIFKINSDGSETQLTFTNKNIYDKAKMANFEERWVKTTDGKEMLVWVIYPPNFDKNKKYPALLYCQGGPQSAVSQFWSYRWNFQMMAAHDYIIVAPNRRGLPTFGQEWNAQISGDYGGQNMKDYFSAIDSLKQEPFIDENNLGAIGASYGGFSVFWLAGHHEGRFKAFISHCGIYNFESMYAQTEETFFTHHDLGGAPWDKENEIAQNSYANSPHHFIKKWDTPILIITGGYDFRIPYTQSLEAFNSAKLLGIKSKLLYFPNETHFVVKPQNSILWQREFFGFLDEELKK